MDRQIVKSGQVPLETDLLASERSTMSALGWLMQGVLGTSTLVDAITCIPMVPASLVIQVTAGSIYFQEAVDATGYSTLAADTTHQLVKQGLLLDTQQFTQVPPGTGGFAQNNLVQAIYQDTDDTPIVRPYYNSANPAVALSGPGGAGTPDNTFRRGQCVVTVKAGTPATSGSQVTPSPDAGYVGLFVVTVANGATTLTSGNIAQLTTAPFLLPNGKLPQIPTGVQSGAWMYGADSGTANAMVVALTPVPSSLVAGMTVHIKKSASGNTDVVTLNVGTGANAVLRSDGSVLQSGDLPGNCVCEYTWDGTEWQVTNSQGFLPNGTTTKRRNYLINGNFFVNQRTFAGGALAAGVYGFDRWKAGAGGCTISVSGGVVTMNGPIKQIWKLEDTGTLASKFVTFSVDAPSVNITATIGDGGSNNVSGTIPLGSGRQGVTLQVPSAATGNISIILTTVTSGTFANVMVEDGKNIRAFEVPTPYNELLLCKRAYRKSYLYGTAPGSVNAGSAGFWTQDFISYEFPVATTGSQQFSQIAFFDVEMWGVPTCKFYDASYSAVTPNSISLFNSAAGAHQDAVGISTTSAYNDGTLHAAAFAAGPKEIIVFSYSASAGYYGMGFGYTADADL